MHPATPCYLLTVTGSTDRRLRRYASGSTCTANEGGCHNAEVPLDVIGFRNAASGSGLWPHDDPRWPAACGCGYVFKPQDEWQLFCNRLWLSSADGNRYRLRDAPPGGIYDADWYHDWPGWTGPDGKSLVVILPNRREWHIDGRASNCTRPDDTVHKCWVRHGEAPKLTVDKDGDSCSAGAGSIQAGDYHGFLRDGVLTAG